MKKKTFRDAYGVLQKHAETLRDQSEPNIDDLLSIVNESVEAYKVCKERIEAVEKALSAALTDVDVEMGRGDGDREEAGRGTVRRVSTQTARPDYTPDYSDEDIPF